MKYEIPAMLCSGGGGSLKHCLTCFLTPGAGRRPAVAPMRGKHGVLEADGDG